MAKVALVSSRLLLNLLSLKVYIFFIGSIVNNRNVHHV